jgi:hypothetical protein
LVVKALGQKLADPSREENIPTTQPEEEKISRSTLNLSKHLEADRLAELLENGDLNARSSYKLNVTAQIS